MAKKQLDISGITNIVGGLDFFKPRPASNLLPKEPYNAPKTPTTPSPAIVEPESIQNTPNVNKLTTQHVNQHVNKLTIENLLKVKGTEVQGARFPDELMELLDDVQHDIKKKHRQKINKQEILVLATSHLLLDYQEKGESSVIYKHLVKPLLTI